MTVKFKKVLASDRKLPIWRLFIASGRLAVIDKRDAVKKEAYFDCLDLFDGSILFENYQFGEKYWIGVEDIFEDNLILHKFRKPDMPFHNGIAVFNLRTKSVLWERDDMIFNYKTSEGLCVEKPSLTGSEFYLIDAATGSILNKLEGDDYSYKNNKGEKDYIFPELLSMSENCVAAEHIKSFLKNCKTEGEIEFIDINGAAAFNAHIKSDSGLSNRLFVFDKTLQKIIFEEELNNSVRAYAPDSFFIYKDLLIFIKERTILTVVQLIK